MNKNLIPNLFTFSNLMFGMLSILFALTGNLKLAATMILCSAFVDRYDGRVARKINAVSPLGKELDSLADLVSFGAAPSVLAWILFLAPYGVIGYIVAIIYPVAGAYRLARYNVTEFHNVYTGVPITIAGALLAVDFLVILFFSSHDIISIILIILLSYLMVSNVKLKKR